MAGKKKTEKVAVCWWLPPEVRQAYRNWAHDLEMAGETQADGKKRSISVLAEEALRAYAEKHGRPIPSG